MNLAERHVEQLQASGICRVCISDLDRQGLVVSTSEGMRLNYPGVEGFYRIRLDNPSSKQKYTQASGTGSRLYLAPRYTRWQTGMDPLFITEGEKKALALDCRFEGSVGAVGIGGVWNWTGGKDRDRRILIEDFRRIELAGRHVFLVFDSDADDNQQVLQAERELARALHSKGAKVKVICLPKERKGIDDWLVAWGKNWRDELRKLALEASSSRTADRYKSIYSQVYSFKEMVGKRFPLPKFFCGDETFGIVGQGMVLILHGPTNIGKTYLSTQLAVSMATGRDWLGHPCSKSKVLVLQGELPPGLFAKSRLVPLLERVGMPDNLEFYNWSFNLAESSRFKEAFTGDAWNGFSELEDMIDERRPDVVVIDPLQSYHNLVEASNDQLRELIKRLKRTVMARNIGIVIVDHDRKSGGDGTSSLRGASAKSDLADTVIGLTRGEDRETLLRYSKVRYINRALPGDQEIHMKDFMFELGPPSTMEFPGEEDDD